MTFLRYPAFILAGIFFLLVTPFSLRAQVNGPGTTGANFVKIGMGARAAGMGDAFAAVADDATAMYWNPAGLVLARGTEFSLTHSDWVQGISDEYLAFSQNLKRDGAFGGALEYLGTGSFAGSLENADGSYGGVGNNINASTYMASAAYAQRLGNWFSGDFLRQSIVGIEVMAIGQNISNVGNSGIAFNLGYIFEAIRHTLFFTFVATDLGTDIQTFSEPLNGNLGASLFSQNFILKQAQNILALDLDGTIDTGIGFKIGDEYKINFDRNGIALRAGYEGDSLDYSVTNLTLGVGLYHSFDDFDASLDYAYVPYSVLGDTDRITLNIVVGGNPVPPLVSASALSAPSFVLGPDKARIQIGTRGDEAITKWKINILNDSGKLIRTVSGKGTPPNHYDWDGRDQTGELVPQGNYSVNVEATDDDDLTGRATPISFNAKWVPKPVPFSYTYGVSGDLLFDSGKPDLLQSGYDVIQKAVAAIRAKFPNSIIQIAGHTDNVKVAPHAAFKDNQELSQLRAQSVMAYLIRTGMNPNLLSAVGYGDTKPIASNDTPEGRAKNRRVELVVSGTVEVTADDLIAAGQQMMAQKNYKEALNDFLKAIQSDSRSAKAYHLAGDCYLTLGGKDQAAQAYALSLKYDPNNQSLRDWLTQYAPQALVTPTAAGAVGTTSAQANPGAAPPLPAIP
jgi:outer membrane protein OmpA-like peptidoglycan-associated protein